MTNQPKLKSAEEILKESVPKDCLWEEMDKLTNTPIKYVMAAMHTYAEQAITELALRIKEDRVMSLSAADLNRIGRIASELITEMKGETK